MTYLALGVVMVWFFGLLFLFGYGLNLSRLVLNNLIPGRNYWDIADYYRWRSWRRWPGIFSMAVRPSDLTELGRQYHTRAIRIDWIMWAWMIGGFFLVVWASAYLMA
jgi:hypothetical protein